LAEIGKERKKSVDRALGLKIIFKRILRFVGEVHVVLL
jgi:hypothetical protein